MFSTQGVTVYEKQGDLNILRMAKIGIGCTTYNRPDCLAKWRKQIAEHTGVKAILNDINYINIVNPNGYDFTIVVADDSIERKGVAFRKNECLRALKDCDYVFLFDDDTYPIKDGWIEFFVNSGEHHLLFLNDKLHAKMGIKNIELTPFNEWQVSLYKDCGGVFMFMTKQAIEKVGAFNEKFEKWGFEHAEYSIRILGEHGKYPMLNGTEEYIYSEDYSNPTHKSSITNEEKDLLFKKNFPIFAKGIENIYIPL